MTKLNKPMRAKCIIHTGGENPALGIARYDTAEMLVKKIVKALERAEKKTANYLAVT